MNRGLIIALGLLGLLFAALAWVLSQVEWIEQEVALGPSEQARREPFLAAQRFLEQQGLAVEVERGLARLDGRSGLERPGQDDVVVLVDAYGMITEPRLQDLLAWVEQGGRLLVSARNPYVGGANLEDALFDYFEVGTEQQLQLDGEEIDEQDLDEPQTLQELLTPVSACSFLVNPIAFNFEGDEHQIQVGFPGWRTLTVTETNEASWISDTLGVRMSQVEWGDGLITFLAGTELWNNRYIGCHDNAYMLLQLTMESDRVWFLVNQDAPSLWELLWRYAWLAVICFGLLLALFLWRQSVRFGPLRAVPDSGRRRLLEHVQAAGHFLWRQHQGPNLVEQVRADIEARLNRRFPAFSRWPQARQYAEISRLSGLPEEQVATAMRGEPLQPPEFTDIIQTLQQIKDKL